MAATPKSMQQSTLSFGLGLTGVAPPPPSAVTRAVMAPADAAATTTPRARANESKPVTAAVVGGLWLSEDEVPSPQDSARVSQKSAGTIGPFFLVEFH